MKKYFERGNETYLNDTELRKLYHVIKDENTLIHLLTLKLLYKKVYLTYNNSMVIVYNENDEVGVVESSSGLIIIPFNRFKDITNSEVDGCLYVTFKDDTVGLVDLNGDICFHCGSEITSIVGLSYNYHRVTDKNGKTGVIEVSDSGSYKLVIPCKYKQIWGCYPKSDLLIIKDENDKRGLMTLQGEIVVPVNKDKVIFVDGGFSIRKGNLFEFLGLDGEVIIPPTSRNILSDPKRLSKYLRIHNLSQSLMCIPIY